MESLISVIYSLQYNDERKKVDSGYYGNTNGIISHIYQKTIMHWLSFTKVGQRDSTFMYIVFK